MSASTQLEYLPRGTQAYFSRHETFHPRYGWLKKGFDKVLEDEGIFLRKDAPVILGVGKNMVRAIRYWCYAFKISEERRSSKGRYEAFSTEFGSRLLGKNGWDPYLENPASLWYLHWKLLKQPCYATTWLIAFNYFGNNEFSTDDLFRSVQDYKNIQFPDSKYVDDSIKKDVSCFLRMYVANYPSAGAMEDSIDSPFVELNLIKQIGDSRHFSFNAERKFNLPDEIIVAACLEYVAEVNPDARTINISQLLYNVSSPGLVFKIGQNTLHQAIDNISLHNKKLAVNDTAGIIQMTFKEEPYGLSEQILEAYYKSQIS